MNEDRDGPALKADQYFGLLARVRELVTMEAPGPDLVQRLLDSTVPLLAESCRVDFYDVSGEEAQRALAPSNPADDRATAAPPISDLGWESREQHRGPSLVLPMQLAGRTFGLVEFSRAPGDPPYEGEALEAARQIALTVSLVLETTRLDDEVEHARRDRERFLSLAAHELKTPITTLSGYAQLTARQMNRPEGIDPERAQRALEAMDRAATRLFRLVVQMLDSANLLNETLVLQVSRVDLVQLVQDVVKAVQAQDTSHPIRLDAPPNLEAVADPARVEQVVLSLLDNAVKYSPEGSEVEVEMGASPTEQVHLVVRDRGIGIAERHRENVFEPFFKEQPTRHVAGTVGMGLGLHATRGIVEKHGGSISLRSRPGGGTEVEVRIPREAETDTQE